MIRGKRIHAAIGSPNVVGKDASIEISQLSHVLMNRAALKNQQNTIIGQKLAPQVHITQEYI